MWRRPVLKVALKEKVVVEEEAVKGCHFHKAQNDNAGLWTALHSKCYCIEVYLQNATWNTV